MNADAEPSSRRLPERRKICYRYATFSCKTMGAAETEPVEEIAADEIEVVVDEPPAAEKVIRISADEKADAGNENPFGKVFENIEEFQKIRFFGIVALIVSLIGIKVFPVYTEIAALLLAGLDIWKGSKFTRKLSYAAIIIAALVLLSNWS